MLTVTIKQSVQNNLDRALTTIHDNIECMCHIQKPKDSREGIGTMKEGFIKKKTGAGKQTRQGVKIRRLVQGRTQADKEE